MSKIVQFNKGNDEEENCCETCDLVREHMTYVMDYESPEELFVILREFAEEAKKLALMEYLIAELDAKVKLLDHLEYGCDEDCDCEE
jgi:hypothetical protein